MLVGLTASHQLDEILHGGPGLKNFKTAWQVRIFKVFIEGTV